MAMGRRSISMWVYERRLQYPVNISTSDKELAKVLVQTMNASSYETGASTRYLYQRYLSCYREISGLLTDIGTEAIIITSLLH